MNMSPKETKAKNYHRAVQRVRSGNMTIWEAASRYRLKPAAIFMIIKGVRNENKFEQFKKENGKFVEAGA